ncbi:MAG: DUF2851 family protein [Rubricoccaceae bacterium]
MLNALLTAPLPLAEILDGTPSGVAEPYPATPSEDVTRVPEVIIQDLWARGVFSQDDLCTASGEPVQILDRGRINHDSGPDVSNARVQIGDVVWAGDIEIHRTSSEWEAHGHHTDPAYDRVVLHVILAPDARTGTLTRADGSDLPELTLLDALDRPLRQLVRDFYLCPTGAPHCRARWNEVPETLPLKWVRALGAERLREKAHALADAYNRQPDPDALLLRAVFRALGYAANADTMEALADRVPLELVRTLSAEDTHALLLGLAGWLDREEDLFDAPTRDRAGRFEVLRTTHELAPMNRAAWRRGGRPANAPTRRIAQAAALLGPGGLFRNEPIRQLADALKTSARAALKLLRTPPSDGSSKLGRGRAEAVLTNAVLPVLLLDAEIREIPDMEALVLSAMDSLSAEHDRVTRPFEDLGLAATSALESQGIHQLARAYCEAGRCASCPIGQALYPGLRAA